MGHIKDICNQKRLKNSQYVFTVMLFCHAGIHFNAKLKSPANKMPKTLK